MDLHSELSREIESLLAKVSNLGPHDDVTKLECEVDDLERKIRVAELDRRSDLPPGLTDAERVKIVAAFANGERVLARIDKDGFFICKKGHAPVRYQINDLDVVKSEITKASYHDGIHAQECYVEEIEESEMPKTFEEAVDLIMDRDRCKRSIAASRARKEYGELFDVYQRGDVSKSYDDLVASEMRKGCSQIVAVQRVATLYPDIVQTQITKAKTSTAEFMNYVGDIQKRDKCSRVQAMDRARREHSDEFDRFQNAT